MNRLCQTMKEGFLKLVLYLVTRTEFALQAIKLILSILELDRQGHITDLERATCIKGLFCPPPPSMRLKYKIVFYQFVLISLLEQ